MSDYELKSDSEDTPPVFQF